MFARPLSLFLLAGASGFVLMTAPALAEDVFVSPAPMVEATGPETPLAASGVEHASATIPPICDGLSQNGGDTLPAFYMAAMARTERTGDVFAADINAGALSVDGKLYPLIRAELPREGAFTLSGTRFDHHIRLLHKAADGQTATLIVPLIEGAPNLAVEALLLPAREEELDLASLFDGARAYARMDSCGEGGNVEPRFILSKPAQISAAQIEKISAAF